MYMIIKKKTKNKKYMYIVSLKDTQNINVLQQIFNSQRLFEVIIPWFFVQYL